MKDDECTAFLQWALPQLGCRWEGFRKVRGQVCRRVERRLRALALPGVAAYRTCLEAHPDEWRALERLCPITISTFYRDKDAQAFLAATVLPALARAADAIRAPVRALSLGCARGEEPYTLRLAWEFAVAPLYSGMALRVVATDVVEELLARARAACYPASSVKLLPRAWREHGFERTGSSYCLRARYRDGVEFLCADVRQGLPPGPFDLILCRNLVFTYFDEPTQRALLQRMVEQLRPGAALVIGRKERLPDDGAGLVPWPGAERLGIFRKSEGEVVGPGV